jgi:hypothetical protein
MTTFLLYGDTNIDWFQNFQHFMEENVCLLGSYISQNLNCPILVPNIIGSKGIPYYNSTLKEILKVLNLEHRVELVNYECKPIITEPMWRITLNKIIFYIHFKNSLPDFKSGPEKIFIKRTWGNKPGEIHGHPSPIRCIINEDLLQTHLESKGFVTVTFKDASFYEKKQLLQNAKEIVTQTGANCVNLFLCDKLEKLTLLTNDVFKMGGYFANIWINVHQKKLLFNELSFESIDKHLLVEQNGMPHGIDNGNFYVNLEQI